MDERREKSIFRILPSYVWQLEKFTLNNEVSPTARALLSLPGIRPGFQEMLR